MKALIQRCLRILSLFALAWGLLFAYNNVGCRKIEGNEMSPTLESDSVKMTWVVDSVDDLHPEDIVHYSLLHPDPRTRQSDFVGRIKGIPGEAVRVESGLWQADGQTLEQVDVIVPRDSFVVVSDHRGNSISTKVDTRGVGPIGIWAVNGKVK